MSQKTLNPETQTIQQICNEQNEKVKRIRFVLFLICFTNACILFTNYSNRQDINKIDDRLEDIENYLIKIRPIQDSVRDEVFDLRETVNTIIVEMKE